MFKNIKGYELIVGNFGGGTNSRIIVFMQRGKRGKWVKVAKANILIVGPGAVKELRQFLLQQPKSIIVSAIPGGMSGRTLTELRRHLGVSKSRGRPRKADQHANTNVMR